MKKIMWIFMTCFLCLMTSCSNAAEQESSQEEIAEESVNEETSENEGQESEEVQEENEEDVSNILIAYFTYGENANLSNDTDTSSQASIQLWEGEITGNTGLLAHMIDEEIEADLFSILTADAYPNNYDDTINQGREENQNDYRPELSSHIENLDQYDTIFLGYPNWWYDLPMSIYSFLEEYDLSGKTIIPFSTSGGSGFSNTIATISELEPDAEVLEGFTVDGTEASNAQESIHSWLVSLGYAE